MVPLWDYSDPVAELHVRNVPTDLHARLQKQAVAEGRSMSAQAIVLLRQALEPTRDQHVEQRAAIERLEEIRRRNQLAADAPLAEQLVREDRDRVR